MQNATWSQEKLMVSYETHRLMIYRICYAYMKNTADTEDLVQDTFIQLIKKQPLFKNAEHEKAWLIRVATNLCKNKLKHWWRKKRTYFETLDPMQGPENLEINEVLQVILDLPDKYKTAIYLYYYEGYNSVEIAEILGKPPSTIRSHLSESRQILKEKLGGEIK